MTTEKLLFPELADNQRRLMPEGFRYEEDIISAADEAALAKSLAALDLKPFEFHGHLGNRRVTSFCLRYDYARHAVKVTDGFPDFSPTCGTKWLNLGVGRSTSSSKAELTNIRREPGSAGIRTSPSLVSSSAFPSWPQRLCASVVQRDEVGSGRLKGLSRARFTSWMVRREPHGSIAFRQWMPCDIP
jgi:hypothetical protein